LAFKISHFYRYDEVVIANYNQGVKPDARLSVIIPVYNGGDFLQETIDSVLNNSDPVLVECLVIDDGSTDVTPQIIASYGHQIRSFRQDNSGEGAAVNKGLREALGEFIVVVSADDPVLTPKLFLGVLDFFEKNPCAVAWYPDWNLIDSKGKILKTIRLPAYDFTDLFSRNRVLPGPGTWFRKKSALAINGRNVKWKYVGDYDFWLRLSRLGSLVHRSEVVAQWRSHSLSTSISNRGVRMAEERIDVIEDFINSNSVYLDKKSISLARAHARYLASRLGFFSKHVNSRKLFFSAIRFDLRVILSIRPHELFFMLTFPTSKKLTDMFRGIRK
jgi:glycosyltransferase involved in cell wall biosynthesis